MPSRALRLYVAAITLLVFFVLWAMVAAKPWASTRRQAAVDPRLVALGRRQRRLERQTRAVKQELDRRWRQYRRRLRTREVLIHTLERRHTAQVAAARAVANAAVAYLPTGASGASTPHTATRAPQVRIVTLPPTTSSGSSHP